MNYSLLKKISLSTILLSLCIILTACHQATAETSSSTEIIEETIIIDEADVSSKQSTSAENTTSVEETPVVSEPVKEPVTSKEEVTAPEKTPSKPVTEENVPSNPSTTAKVVQRANPETGISWDGVSPIIYTYPDGTTGTEKREGATYEGLPGMITTVVTVDYGKEMNPSKKPLTCTECGKELGDGTNGTCLSYWTGGDHECANCGEIIPENTCHTCNK